MKTCLVLEGGAMRGMYTAGALDVFYNAGIQFDGIIGVSAGAAFGVNYLSRQPGRVIRYNKRFNADHHYMGLIPPEAWSSLLCFCSRCCWRTAVRTEPHIPSLITSSIW